MNDYFQFEPDETSPSYYRFLEHISMMSNYVFGGDETGDEDDGLYDFVAEKYPEIAACAGNIERMIVMKYKGKLSRNDQAALILYMQRLLRR